jgi:iron complex outermembrane receptor protein
MKLKTFNYDAKYYLPKVNLESIVEFKECIKLIQLGEEYLIPDATTNDFGVLGLLIMSGIITAYFRQVCV